MLSYICVLLLICCLVNYFLVIIIVLDRENVVLYFFWLQTSSGNMKEVGTVFNLTIVEVRGYSELKTLLLIFSVFNIFTYDDC